ncbi:hypothetical protein D3C84_1270360 [compost metagenome]
MLLSTGGFIASFEGQLSTELMVGFPQGLFKGEKFCGLNSVHGYAIGWMDGCIHSTGRGWG